MGLIECLTKTAANISKEDRDWIINRSNELKEKGTPDFETKALIDYQEQKIHKPLEDFKKEVIGKKYTPKEFVPPVDKSEEIKNIQEDYNKRIEDKKQEFSSQSKIEENGENQKTDAQTEGQENVNNEGTKVDGDNAPSIEDENKTTEDAIPPNQQQDTETVNEPEGEGWTHINEADITPKVDLVKNNPLHGGKVGWAESVDAAMNGLAKEAKSGETLADVAKRKIAEWGVKIDKELEDNGKSTFNPSDEDLAVMSFYRTHLNTELNNLNERLNSEDYATRQSALNEAQDIQNRIFGVDHVLSESGKVAGRSFYIRQMIAKMNEGNRLTVRRMDIMRSQDGEPLSADQETAVTKLVAEENKLQKEAETNIPKYSQEDFEAKVKEEVDRLIKEKKGKNSETKSEKTLSQSGKELADKIRRLKTQKGDTALDVTFGLKNLAVEAVAQLVEQGAKLGDAIKSVLKDIKYKGLSEDDLTKHILGGFEKSETLDKIKELSEKENSDNLTKSAVGKGLVNDLVNNHIENGLRGKEVFDALGNDLKDLFPNITEQQIRDAYLKEGDYKLDKKEVINKEKKEAHAELSNIAKLETDIELLNGLKKTRQRNFKTEREKTDAENELIKQKQTQLNEIRDRNNAIKKGNNTLETERIRQLKKVDELKSKKAKLEQGIKEKSAAREKVLDTPEIEQLKSEIRTIDKELSKIESDRNKSIKKGNRIVESEAIRQVKKVQDLQDKKSNLEKGIREKRSAQPKFDTPEIENLKGQVKQADDNLREAESLAKSMDKDIQDKKDKIGELDANIKRAENDLELIKTARNKSDRKIDADIESKRKELATTLNKKGIKLERSPKEEVEVKKKVAQAHNDRMDELVKKVDDKLSDTGLSDEDRKALNDVKNTAELSKVNLETGEKIDNALNKINNKLGEVAIEVAGHEDILDAISSARSDLNKDLNNAGQDIGLIRHKANLKKKITESERKIEAGEFDETPRPVRSRSDAEAIRLEIEQRKIEGKYRRLQELAENKNKTWYEKAGSLASTAYIQSLIGGLKTNFVVLSSALTKQPLNTVTNATFGNVAHALSPTLSKAAGAEAPFSLRQETNRYLAHYAAIGEEGMRNRVAKYEAKLSDANRNYEEVSNRVNEELKNHEAGSPEYKKLTKELQDAKNKQTKALLDNQSNFLFKWIGSNAWKDSADVFLKGASTLEEQMGYHQKVGWKDMTPLEKTEFSISVMGAMHGYFKNFSARAEFAAAFTARLENKLKRGIDISQPEEVLKTATESYVNYQMGKYQEDNYATLAMNAIGKTLEKVGSEPSRYSADPRPKNEMLGKLAAAVYKGKYPILRTGVNIGREAIVEYLLGTPIGAAMHGYENAKALAKSYKNGTPLGETIRDHIMSLPTDKVDLIFRCYRKGGLGLVAMALAGMGFIKFGGFYDEDDRGRKKGELKQGELEVFGKKLGHNNVLAKIIEHSGASMGALMVANYKQVYDRKFSRGKHEQGDALASAQAAVISDMKGALGVIPVFASSSVPLSNASFPYGKAAGDVQQYFDTDKEGNQIERDKSTWWNRFKINTGFGNYVPEKENAH